jgi:hypothetical protein
MAFKKSMQAGQHEVSEWSLFFAAIWVVIFTLLGFALNYFSGLLHALKHLQAVPVYFINLTRKTNKWIKGVISSVGAENVWYRRMYRD